MDCKEIAKKIREQLKVNGINNKQVSVRSGIVGFSQEVNITIKDATIKFDMVDEMAHKYESIDYDEATGEILSGGNTYIDVSFSYDVIKKEREKYIPFAKKIIDKYKDTPSEELVSVAKMGDYEILYSPNDCIELCKRIKNKCADGTEYVSLTTIKRYMAYDENAIAEGIQYFVNQYDFKIAI